MGVSACFTIIASRIYKLHWLHQIVPSHPPFMPRALEVLSGCLQNDIFRWVGKALEASTSGVLAGHNKPGVDQLHAYTWMVTLTKVTQWPPHTCRDPDSRDRWGKTASLEAADADVHEFVPCTQQHRIVVAGSRSRTVLIR
jgi:hypothetical protein